MKTQKLDIDLERTIQFDRARQITKSITNAYYIVCSGYLNIHILFKFITKCEGYFDQDEIMEILNKYHNEVR